jgi:hypothetical protein
MASPNDMASVLSCEPSRSGRIRSVFFDWPGRSDGQTADPKTVHTFVTANAAALSMLRDELPRFIGWVEFLPEGLTGADSPHREIGGEAVHLHTIFTPSPHALRPCYKGLASAGGCSA